MQFLHFRELVGMNEVEGRGPNQFVWFKAFKGSRLAGSDVAAQLGAVNGAHLRDHRRILSSTPNWPVAVSADKVRIKGQGHGRQ